MTIRTSEVLLGERHFVLILPSEIFEVNLLEILPEKLVYGFIIATNLYREAKLFWSIHHILLVFSVSYVLGRATESFMPHKSEEIAVFPLATSLLAGSGSISIVILMANPPYGPLMTFIAIAVNIVIVWGILRAGGFLHGKLGKQGSSVVSRLMGLIIGAVAIKLIRETLEETLPGLLA